MRKIFLFIAPLLFCVFSINAQSNNAEENAAISLVSASKATLGLSAEDLGNVMVSSTYFDKTSGVTRVYLIQTYKGIPVYNQMLVLAFRADKLVSNAGTFDRSIEKFANVNSGIPSVSAESAVQSALSDRGLHATQMAVAINRKNNGKFIEFSNMGISRENITAQLIWAPIENSKEFHLAWQIYIIPRTTADYWMVRVDAVNNSILGMDNYTDYDHWGTPDVHAVVNYPAFSMVNMNAKTIENNLIDFKRSEDPSVVTTASYRVIPFPAEAPSFPLGAHAIRTDPWLAAPGNATTLKWHTGAAATDYSYTRSNNVFAYQDRANDNNGSVADAASSSTAFPNLTFDFTPDYTVAPTQTTPVPNQQFNTTNLFYWNNILHDIMYIYGMDEAGGNFQDDNMGRGGAGNDHVNAEAQDGGGTNNANFSTPADGGSGRMQMYLWTAANPDRDGDVDNGIIVHEFGHGISNRLTGGPAASGCMSNAESMGEGISDYYGLMFTQDWATATLNTGFNSPRGIGTYALNQPPTGLGIRSQRYCTDFTVNNKVYLAVLPTAVHSRGEIWCATIWDMTWNIINQVGVINPNLYDLAGGGGNNIAMRLVTEGLKTQQCSPGFISARNAILQADQTLYGGLYSCSIWEAFRRRGMGAFASEGSTSASNDQVPDFTPPVTFGATVSAATIPEGQNLNYINSITTCSALSGFTLRDTLPANVTYVSGGTYDAPTRVVSFAVNQGAGTTDYPFTVNVNAGSYFPPVSLINETVASPTIPASWTTTAPLGTIWTVVTTQSNSAPNAFYVNNLPADGDQRLETTTAIALPANSYPKLSFWHRFNTEDGWDGGVVEISTNGGTTWSDLGANMIVGGYNGGLGVSPNNPLGGRSAFTGLTPGTAFMNTIINLSEFAGQSVKLRFRFGSDNNTTAPTAPAGWWVDDITLDAIAAVPMRSSLFNAANARVFYRDMITEITQVVACAPVINQHPVDASACVGSSVNYNCVGVATGGVTYQWQLSTTGIGGAYSDLTNGAPYSGVTTTTLTVNPTVIGMDGYYFRCVVTGTCAPTATSSSARLTVAAASVGGSVDPPVSQVCGIPNSGTLTLSGHTGSVIRWESATNIAGPWTTIVNTSTTYSFTNLTQTTFFRAVVQFATCTETPSTIATVTFTASVPLVIVADPGTTLCEGDPTLLTVRESGGVLSPVPELIYYDFESAGTSVPNLASAPPPGTLTGTIIGGQTQGANGICGTGSLLGNGGSSATNYVNTGWATNLGSSSWTMSFKTENLNTTFNYLLGDNTAGSFRIFANGAAGVNNLLLRGPFTQVVVTGASTAAQHTVTFVYDNTLNNIRAYLDGVLNNTVAQGAININGAGPFKLGGYATSGGLVNGATIDEFRMYNRALMASEITSLAACSAPPGPPATGTFLWSPAAGLSSTTTNPVAASPMTTTTYTVLNDNGAGCVRQANITITVNQRPTITAQPAGVTVCNTLSTSFTVTGTGTALAYQWQVSPTGIGGPWSDLANGTPYAGVTTATLVVDPVDIAMNGFAYRCVLSGACAAIGTANISDPAILTVNALPTVSVTPTTGCGGVAGINGLALTASGADTYSWSPVAGLYTDAAATVAYTGGNAATVYAAPTAFTAYTVTGTNTSTACSNSAVALINYTPPAPTVVPSSVTMCLGNPAVKLMSSSSQSFSQSFSSGTVNINIPDGPGIPPVPTSYPAVTSNISVSGIPAGAIITNVRARFNITHVWVSDLVIALKAPNGNIYNLDALVNRTNQSGANFINTVIGATGANLNSGSSPYTGTFKADGAGATFTALGFTWPGGPTGYIPNTPSHSGLYSIPNGVWSIGIYDAGAPDGGTLNDWSLDIDYVVGVPATPAVWTPEAGLFSDAAATIPYVAGTAVDSVWTRPSPSGVYNYQATVQSLPTPPANPTTAMTGGNGNFLVSFNVRNNNGYPVTFNSIASNSFGSGAVTARVFYKTTGNAGNPGPISAANGWNQFGTANVTVTAGTLNPLISGLTLVVPPGATYGIALDFSGATFPAYTNGGATPVVYSDGGCDIIVSGNVGWGGPAAPGTPVNNPRNFNGSIGFVANFPACTSPARTVVVTVNEPTTLDVNLPVNQTICTDKVATFSIAVTAGTGPHSYQWQESTDGGNTYTNINNGGVYSGATGTTLTITAPPVSMSGYYYRCVITGAAPCAAVTSIARTLTVNPLPVIVIAASPYTSLFPGLVTTLSSTVSPNPAASYTWVRNGSPVPGASSATLSVDVDGMGDYQLLVTDVNGCTNISNTVTIKDSVSGKCFIYPNPNSGQFQVRYYSAANNVLPRSLTVYDAKGDRVLTQLYTIGRPYDRMDVDMRAYGKGLYWVEIGDLNGNRLTMCRVVIQ